MKTVNRFALIITPKPSFYALLTRVSGEQFDPPNPTDEENSHVYLIPGDFTYQEEALEWLEEYRQHFFEAEFLIWCEDESKLPQDISWSDFLDYFVFSIQSMVTDAAPDEPVHDEDSDEGC